VPRPASGPAVRHLPAAVLPGAEGHCACRRLGHGDDLRLEVDPDLVTPGEPRAYWRAASGTIHWSASASGGGSGPWPDDEQPVFNLTCQDGTALCWTLHGASNWWTIDPLGAPVPRDGKVLTGRYAAPLGGESSQTWVWRLRRG
jgi:hypothetical protein